MGGNVSLTSVDLVGNGTQGLFGAGGGVANFFGANMTVNASSFSGNQAFGFGFGAGRGIFIDGSTLTVNDSTFSENAGIAAVGLNPATKLLHSVALQPTWQDPRAAVLVYWQGPHVSRVRRSTAFQSIIQIVRRLPCEL